MFTEFNVNMVDLNQQTEASRRVLSSVVALAVNDACAMPVNKSGFGKKSKYQLTTDAFTAMRFIFDDERSGLDAYALWLDFEVKRFREKLLAIMNNHDAGPVAGFDSERRRNFRFNYRQWSAMRFEDVPEEEE